MRPLKCAVELEAKPLPEPAEGGIESQCCESIFAGAQIARPTKGIALIVDDQNLVLQLADEIVAEVELEQAVAEDRVFDGGSEFPRPLGHELGIGARDTLGRQVADTDEIVEVQLGDGAPYRELSVPTGAGLPVQRDVRLQEFQRSVGYCVSANAEIRKFVIEATIEPQVRRQRLAGVDVDLAALLLDRRVGDRERNADLGTVFVDGEQVDLVVERVVRRLGAGLERESEQVRAGPAQAAKGLIAPGAHLLLETAVHDCVVLQQAIVLNIIIEIVALAARSQGDELDGSAGKRARDIAAKLDDRVAVALDEIVVVNRRASRSDAVVLEQVEAAWLPARIQADCLVRAVFISPGGGQERVLVKIAVVLSAMLDEIAGCDVSQVVGAFLELPVAAGAACEVEGIAPAAEQRRSLDVGVDVARVP